MKTFSIAALSLAFVAGLAVSSDAEARRGHHRHHHHGARVGLFIGAPLFPYYHSPYYYPRYYYPPAVVAAPPVYIEQGTGPAAPLAAAPAAAPAGAYWHYCQDSQTYYPYVQQCASPWQQVVPQASATLQ